MLKNRRDILEAQLSFLLSLDSEDQICSTCNFPKDLHDDINHEFTGWTVDTAISKLKIELRGLQHV